MYQSPICTIVDDIAIFTIRVEENERYFEHLTEAISKSAGSGNLSGIIFDLSEILVLGHVGLIGLQQVVAFSRVVGLSPMICGLRPGIAAFIAESDIEIKGLQAAFNVDSALKVFSAQRINDEAETNDPAGDCDEAVVVESLTDTDSLKSTTGID